LPAPISDAALVHIVDAALADSARRSGRLLACKAGCHQCCIGVFAISQLDALRLRTALSQLAITDPARAAAIRTRVAASLSHIAAGFPGDHATGLLPEFSEPSAAADRFDAAFDDYANDEVCPVLDPATGTCELYAARPIPCRTFGPPMRNAEGGLAVCELCYHGATPAQIAACEMLPDPDALEDQLIEQLPGSHAQTIIAYALRGC